MSNNAKETMDKMGDIVWMSRPNETDAANLQQCLEKFAYEICSRKNIETNMDLGVLKKAKLSMAQRKNIYLIFKEALNNAAKYINATFIEVATAQTCEFYVLMK